MSHYEELPGGIHGLKFVHVIRVRLSEHLAQTQDDPKILTAIAMTCKCTQMLRRSRFVPSYQGRSFSQEDDVSPKPKQAELF